MAPVLGSLSLMLRPTLSDVNRERGEGRQVRP